MSQCPLLLPGRVLSVPAFEAKQDRRYSDPKARIGIHTIGIHTQNNIKVTSRNQRKLKIC